jgi:hypothetical protein
MKPGQIITIVGGIKNWNYRYIKLDDNKFGILNVDDKLTDNNGLARFCGVDAELTKAERATIGKDYHKQDQIVKDINKIKDPKAKRDAIDAELERVKKLIGSI